MRKFLFVLLLLLYISCEQKATRKPGICLSFDDRTIEEWYSMRLLLNKYNARVTFFVTQFDSLSLEEIDLLKELEQEGHEIGSHGALHVLSETYIKEKSYNEYIKNEIDASISTMKQKGFSPKAFAYPYGAKYWFTDWMLLKKFDVVRGVVPVDSVRELAIMDEIYYQFDGERVLYSVGIDQNCGLTKDMISKAISRAFNKKEVLMLYGHFPAMEGHNEPYSFNKDLFEFLLREANKNDLEFLTFKDLISQ